MDADTARTGRRRFAVDAVWLGIGAGVSGIAAYVFAAIGNRALGAPGFAPVSVLWTAWAVTAAAVAFPVQHWVIRRISADGTEAGVRAALPRLVGIAGLLGLSLGLVGWLAREDLFRRDDATFPVLLGVIAVGAVAMGLLRGGLSARGRFAATGGALAGENLIRVALAVVGAAAGWGAQAFGVALVAGFGVGALWPGAFRFARSATEHRGGLGFLGGIAAGSLLAQLVLTGAPIALALLDAPSAQITTMFVALALFRAPYIVAAGVASRITGTLTRFVVAGHGARLRTVQLLTLGITAVTALAGAGIGAAIGPAALRLLFGDDIRIEAGIAAVVAAGACVALGTLVQGLVLVSRARSGQLAASWLAALAVAVAWAAAGPGAPLPRVALAFLIGECVAFVIMLGLEARALREAPRVEDVGAISGA